MARFLKYLTTTQKGFTLIELTIVFTIIAVIGGIGFASYTSFSSRQKLDQAAYDLKAGIDEAKHMAISRVKPASCGATTALDGYRITICVNGGNCTNSANLYEITPICIPPPVSPPPISKVKNSKIILSKESCGTGANAVIDFHSQVGIISGTCSISLLNQEDNTFKTVCVDAGGNVSVTSGSC
ncbi:MAG: type II secretion system protein [Candidatus Levybacteria bacterium]|nr:type II secretion system protein [Candidatus Levybacteria bacterium]